MSVYQERVAKALNFIESNLQEDLSLDQIASEACYSKYHFTRIFAKLTGETVGEYIRKRRISESATDLLATDQSILQVALSYQFDSQEAYTRSFQSVFKVSPGKYRKLEHKFVPFERYKLSQSAWENLEHTVTMEPRIIMIEDRKLVGMNIQTTLTKKEETIQLWKNFMPRRFEIDDHCESGYFSVQCYNNGSSYESFTPHTVYQKWAAIEVHKFGAIPEGMEKHLLQGGQYAVFTHQGPMDVFKHTMDYIYQIWLPNSGYQLDDRDHFEIMGNKYFGPNHPESEEDVWVPIK